MVLSDNLFNLSQMFTSPDIVKKFSRLLGESEDKTKAGLKSDIPTLLMGIADKGTTPEGAETIVNLAKNHPTDPDSPANDVSETNLSEGNSVLNGIFGSGLTPMISKLGTFTGLNTSSISKMLGLATPLIMGAIGTKVKKDNLSAAGLMGFFKQQKTVLSGLIPSSLGGRTSESFGRDTMARRGFSGLGTHVYHGKKRRPWLFATLVVLAAIIGIWIHTKNQTEKIPETAITAAPSNASSMPATKFDEPFTTQTPGNVVNQAPTSSATTQRPTSVAATDTTGATALSELSAFLKTGDAAAVPKRFSFKNLNFASSSTTLIAGAETELDLIATALKETPTSTATIEGYTDNTGNAAANQALSEARAQVVKEQLVSRGIAADRIEAIGKGSNAAIAPNDTTDGKAKNRRIEFIITKIK